MKWHNPTSLHSPTIWFDTSLAEKKFRGAKKLMSEKTDTPEQCLLSMSMLKSKSGGLFAAVPNTSE